MTGYATAAESKHIDGPANSNAADSKTELATLLLFDSDATDRLCGGRPTNAGPTNRGAGQSNSDTTDRSWS
eukprot:1589563-Rhodomonas_salina.2